MGKVDLKLWAGVGEGLGEWWGAGGGGVPGPRPRTGLLSSQSCRVADTLPQRTKPGAQIPGCVDTARKVSGDQERAPWFTGMLQIALFLPEKWQLAGCAGAASQAWCEGLDVVVSTCTYCASLQQLWG